LGLAAASVGSTIYEGDRLSTVDGGAMRISGSGLTLQLDTRSSVTLRRTAPAGTVQAELGLGTLIFSAAQGSAISVLADDALLRPVGIASTMAHIRVVSPKELRIYAQRGALDFSYHGESAVIPEGSAYRVLLDPSEKDSAEGSKSDHPGKKLAKIPMKFLLIAIGIAVAVAIPLVSQNSESPDRPGPLVLRKTP
jgi:hypothetical protein